MIARRRSSLRMARLECIERLEQFVREENGFQIPLGDNLKQRGGGFGGQWHVFPEELDRIAGAFDAAAATTAYELRKTGLKVVEGSASGTGDTVSHAA